MGFFFCSMLKCTEKFNCNSHLRDRAILCLTPIKQFYHIAAELISTHKKKNSQHAHFYTLHFLEVHGHRATDLFFFFSTAPCSLIPRAAGGYIPCSFFKDTPTLIYSVRPMRLHDSLQDILIRCMNPVKIFPLLLTSLPI